MYSLIWVGWVLVELFVENHQILRFSGRDWIFFCQCCYFDEWKCGSILKFVGKGCRGGGSQTILSNISSLSVNIGKELVIFLNGLLTM